MSRTTSDLPPVNRKGILIGLGLIFLFLVFLVGSCAGIKEFNRYQKRADARNDTRVRYQEVKTYEGQVEIEKEKANIRRAEADGIRDAQDTIAATLTPMYLQHEAIQAQEANAQYGNATIYIPSSEMGVPLTGTFSAETGK